MTSLVRQLEAAVIAAIETATDGLALVRGFREKALAGEVKTSDGDGRPQIVVRISPPTAASYASPVLEFAASVFVSLAWADDPTIAAFDEVAARVERLLVRFNANGNIEAMSAALSTSNFRANGFRLDDGVDSAIIENAANTITTTMNFAVKGVFKETEE